MKKANRVVNLIKNEFGDDINSFSISSNSLNYVAANNGGKHIEDRILSKTEKAYKTDAAELKYYYDTVYMILHFFTIVVNIYIIYNIVIYIINLIRLVVQSVYLYLEERQS